VDYLVGTIILFASLLVEHLVNTILRFWRTVRRIEPHAVVGTIILLASLLVFVVLPLLQKPPSHTTLYFFNATIVPLSFGYVVYQNWELLRWVWKHPFGKVAYGLLASVIGTASKVWTDQQIRSLTQSNPSLFPSAQQAITVLNFIIFAFSAIVIAASVYTYAKLIWFLLRGYVWTFIREYTLMFLTIFIRPRSRQPLPSLYWVVETSAYIWALFFIGLVSSLLDTGFSGSFFKTDLAEFGVKPINLTELFLIHTSFIENYSMGADHCINLPPNARVSPFDTREPTPNRVLMAQPINSGPDRSGRSYTYRVVPCSKPTDPERGP
jgi:hypothetical protein